MPPITLGHPLNSRDDAGLLRVNIATVFPDTSTIVTEPPNFHALQRFAYIEHVNAERAKQNLPQLTEDEESRIIERAVDLVCDDRGVFIRPDTTRMSLALAADQLLQEIIPKRSIKYLWVNNAAILNGLKRRGENWRIYRPPTDEPEIIRTILDSRTAIGGVTYYYSAFSGTRWLTFAEFAALDIYPDPDLQAHLLDIADLIPRRNRGGFPEMSFFESPDFTFTRDQIGASQNIRETFNALRTLFRKNVPDDFQTDDVHYAPWRSRMFNRLIATLDTTQLDCDFDGLDAAFSMRIEWLPGARIDDGELFLDPALEESYGPERQRHVSPVVRGLILNISQDFENIEYLNLGKVLPSMTRNPDRGGRREVYIAQIKQRNSSKEIHQIIRMQKWGIAERLDSGQSMEQAMVGSEEYTEYIIYRLVACRQLRMISPQHLVPRKVGEIYEGHNAQYRGRRIYTPYFLRNYIAGTATDAIPPRKLHDGAYAMVFARLLGQAAATNLILGRAELTGQALFDVGDELVIENDHCQPISIAVGDHVGTFVDWELPLRSRAAEYAKPVLSRKDQVPDAQLFARSYLDGFSTQFTRTRDDYLHNRRAFDSLFKHQTWSSSDGSLPSRWEKILERLANTDPHPLIESIAQHIQAGLTP